MTLFRTRALFIVLAVVAHGYLWAGDPPAPRTTVATVTKVVHSVSRRSGGGMWDGVQKGDRLQSGDMIKTGGASYAIVKFSDNSLLHMRENSELMITGVVRDKALTKSVDLETGGIGFKIPPQRAGEAFRFTSPTSVASIRGTAGLFAASDSTDTLTVLEGIVTFFNKLSSSTIDVGAGYTGVSARNGTLSNLISTSEQRSAAEAAVRTGDQQRRFELELRNGTGKSKKLRIDYKE